MSAALCLAGDVTPVLPPPTSGTKAAALASKNWDSPYYIALRAVIVINNAAYHRRRCEAISTTSWCKAQIAEWLIHKNIDVDDEMLKWEMLYLVSQHKHKFEKYKVDEMVKAQAIYSSLHSVALFGNNRILGADLSLTVPVLRSVVPLLIWSMSDSWQMVGSGRVRLLIHWRTLVALANLVLRACRNPCPGPATPRCRSLPPSGPGFKSSECRRELRGERFGASLALSTAISPGVASEPRRSALWDLTLPLRRKELGLAGVCFSSVRVRTVSATLIPEEVLLLSSGGRGELGTPAAVVSNKKAGPDCSVITVRVSPPPTSTIRQVTQCYDGYLPVADTGRLRVPFISRVESPERGRVQYLLAEAKLYTLNDTDHLPSHDCLEWRWLALVEEEEGSSLGPYWQQGSPTRAYLPPIEQSLTLAEQDMMSTPSHDNLPEWGRHSGARVQKTLAGNRGPLQGGAPLRDGRSGVDGLRLVAYGRCHVTDAAVIIVVVVDSDAGDCSRDRAGGLRVACLGGLECIHSERGPLLGHVAVVVGRVPAELLPVYGVEGLLELLPLLLLCSDIVLFRIADLSLEQNCIFSKIVSIVNYLRNTLQGLRLSEKLVLGSEPRILRRNAVEPKHAGTPKQDANSELPVIGRLVYCKSDTLDLEATEADLVLPLEELFRLLMLHMLDLREPRELGLLGGVWKCQPLSEPFKSAITCSLAGGRYLFMGMSKVEFNWSEFLVTDSKVPGLIPGAFRFCVKQCVWKWVSSTSLRTINEELLERKSSGSGL
uniref:(California timema) hypothetical protein n=1 Tax=Timema californicum TaxID=61474 RepID=A0A7R9J0M8_TIMCA|nr:unnamed protein product [Timema californicum]